MNGLLEKIKKIDLIERFALDTKKIVLIIIISVMFLYLDFAYLLKAQSEGLKKISSEVGKINNDLLGLEMGLKNMEAIRAQQKNLPKKKAKRMISESQLSSLLHDISKIGNAHNVRILYIKPSREMQKGAVVAKLTPVFINLDLVVGYHDLGKFINGLENDRTFISVESFKIEARPEEALKQRVNLTLKTYVTK
jgi:Tfp pilus assembly protein PilO